MKLRDQALRALRRRDYIHLPRSVRYALIAIAVLADVLEDRVVDGPLMSMGVLPYQTGWDDVLSGGLLGILIWLALWLLDRAKQEREEKLRVIEAMNHHVRNALQVIRGRVFTTVDAAFLSDIDDAVNRIDWALREILPGRKAVAVEGRPWNQQGAADFRRCRRM